MVAAAHARHGDAPSRVDRREPLRVPGEATRDGLEKDDAEREDVGPPVDRGAHGLLGRHVGRRPERRARSRERALVVLELREAEVGDLDAPVGRHEDVPGLQVAMKDALLVGVVDRAGHGAEDLDGRPPTESA